MRWMLPTQHLRGGVLDNQFANIGSAATLSGATSRPSCSCLRQS